MGTFPEGAACGGLEGLADDKILTKFLKLLFPSTLQLRRISLLHSGKMETIFMCLSHISD